MSRINLEKIISLAEKMQIPLLLGSPTLHGEMIDGSNVDDEYFEEFSAVCEKLCKGKKFAKFVDLRMEILKYLEDQNTENVAVGKLTFDGRHLNPVGHDLIASILIREILHYRSHENIKYDL
jgi:lysophospholipase L1-like esterase